MLRRLAVLRVAPGVRNCGPAPDVREPGIRAAVGSVLVRGFGVAAVLSSDGMRVTLRRDGSPAVRAGVCLGRDPDASDMGGDGGSVSSEPEVKDLTSPGVVMRGELAVDWGDVSMLRSKVGEPIAERSVEMVERWRDSCFLILSCISSASILRSASSSRKRCDSIRSFSRSCSPIFISPSKMTARSIAWLYFDSISSSDEVVLRA